MQFWRAALAHILAIEAAALAICLSIMVYDGGLVAIGEGLGVFIFAQAFIIPVAIFTFPALLLIRVVLGLWGHRAKMIALSSGGAIGAAMGAVFWGSMKDIDITNLFLLVFLCALAGILGGYVWWRVEDPHRFQE